MGCTSKWRGSKVARRVLRVEGRGPQEAEDCTEMGLEEKSMYCCGKMQGLGKKSSPISNEVLEPTPGWSLPSPLRARSEATGYR